MFGDANFKITIETLEYWVLVVDIVDTYSRTRCDWKIGFVLHLKNLFVKFGNEELIYGSSGEEPLTVKHYGNYPDQAKREKTVMAKLERDTGGDHSRHPTTRRTV